MLNKLIIKAILVISFLIVNCPFAISQNLEQTEQFWREKVVQYCGAYPSKEKCDDGDSLIFNGMLCVVGENIGCETVKASQDTSGRFWRSPRRNPDNIGEDKTFSRDQTLGVLLYLAVTKDQESAIRWWNWIEEHKVCNVKKLFGRGCAVTTYRVCTDSRNDSCNLSPTTLALFYRVWKSMGLNSTGPMRDFNEFDVGDGEIISINNTEPGYQLHLKGVGTLLRLYLRSSTSRSFVIASALNKLQPNNPFFELLSKGPSIELEEKLLQLCPSESSKLDFLRFQWSWERKDSEEAWRQTMGWDCIFISKLLRNYDSLLPRP